eukprot:scaffold3066_cov178-Amphora_coffeaeformis.AAC.3
MKKKKKTRIQMKMRMTTMTSTTTTTTTNGRIFIPTLLQAKRRLTSLVLNPRHLPFPPRHTV